MELSSIAGNVAPRTIIAAPDKPVTPGADVRSAAPPRAPEPAAAAEPPEPSAAQLSQAVKNINTALQTRSQDLEFSVDSDTSRLIVTVTDKNTKEVIRQMPSKEALEIAKAIDHLQSLLIRQTA